jgi:hypothetical protein
VTGFARDLPQLRIRKTRRCTLLQWPRRHARRGPLARLLGDEPARTRELREAERLFREMGAPLRAAAIARELGEAAE